MAGTVTDREWPLMVSSGRGFISTPFGGITHGVVAELISFI